MISIRKASLQDVPRILDLYAELSDEEQNVSPDKIQSVFAEIMSMPNHDLLVAEKDGLVVGTLLLQIVPNLSRGATPWAILENVVVDRRYHRQGIGRLLIERALTICREANCHKVQLLSNQKRLEAHRFYRALGFEDSAVGFRLRF